MRRQSRVAKWFVGTISILLFAAVAVFIFQPHLYRAVKEGFPAPQWPASGTFATVNGIDQKLPQTTTGQTTTGKATIRLSQLLSQSNTKQFLVLHNGKVVLEKNLGQTTFTDRFNSYSLVKSLIGALVFKAVAEGEIPNLDTPIQSYVGQLKGRKLGGVPLSAFLDMKSGVLFEHKGSKAISVREPIDLQASFANPFGPMVKLHTLGLRAVVDNLRFEGSAQQKFNYQNVNTALLAAALEKVYGIGIEKLLEEKIWQPAGAGKAFWRQYADGEPVSAYCCLYATTRDWARVGRFLARNGTPANPFLPKHLWQKFFGVGLAAKQLNKGVYANHLRHDILNRKGEPLQGPFSYFMGHNGQVVYLMPDKDLIVVRFGDNPQLLHSTLYEVWKSISPH